MQRMGTLLSVALAATLSASQARTDDWSYLSAEERQEEIAARTADLQRLTQRLETLRTALDAAHRSAQQVDAQRRHHKRAMEKQARLLHRLFRSGQMFKYLFTSQSATQAAKRMEALQRVFTYHWRAWRAANASLAENQDRIQGLGTDIDVTSAAIAELRTTLRELQSATDAAPPPPR